MRIWAAQVHVDHFSDHTYVHLMRDLTIDETLVAKEAYERYMNQNGHTVDGYRGDNGRFSDKGFRDSCEQNNQSLTFCGVGAHHQNGIVERRNQEITLIARTMLLHAKRHWPEMITNMLWPFALKMAAERLNNFTENAEGLSPQEVLSGCKNEIDIRDFHTFGCPVFVLDHRLQGGLGGPPKWDPRARVGIYLGRSPCHAGNVALVLNPRTGHMSPQYHVVFDDDFTTVSSMREGVVPPSWAALVRLSSECPTRETYNTSDTWTSDWDKSDNPDTAGEFKNGDNGNYIDGNLLFGKPSTPLVNTGLSETPTANGIHERVRVSTQEENSALR